MCISCRIQLFRRDNMKNLNEKEIKIIEEIFNKKYLEFKEKLLSLLVPCFENGDVTLIAPCVDIIFSEVKRDAYKIVISNEGNDPFLSLASDCESCRFYLTDGNADLVQAKGLLEFFFNSAAAGTLNVKT